MKDYLKTYKLFLDSVVAIISAPFVFWCQVPIFIFSLRETPVLLVLLTFVTSLFLSISVQAYSFKLFKMIGGLYVLCVTLYLAFVTYVILAIGWWKLLAFALFAFILGVAIKRWKLATWGALLVFPFSITHSFSFSLVVAMLLVLMCYRFFARREAVMAALFVYSFLLHGQLLRFFTEPIAQSPLADAETFLIDSQFARSQPFSLEVIDGETLAAFYPQKAIVLINVNSGAIKLENKQVLGLKKVGIDWNNRKAIGYAMDKKAVFITNLDNEKVEAELELGLNVDFTGFFGALGFAVDSKNGVIVFFDPSSAMSLHKRLEMGRSIADVCVSDNAVILVSTSGEIFLIERDLNLRWIADMFGYFWFSCASISDNRFVVASPTSGAVAIVQGNKHLRSIFAGSGAWAMAHEDDKLYVGNLFSGEVKKYNLGDWKVMTRFKTCQRLKAITTSDEYLFASTQCGLLRFSAF